jgi:hypothetical protein
MRIILAACLILVAPAGFAQEEAIPAETIAEIEAMLTEMECQMDPDDIEREGDGYELDDVICKGGNQFDIVLDADLNEVDRRAE